MYTKLLAETNDVKVGIFVSEVMLCRLYALFKWIAIRRGELERILDLQGYKELLARFLN
jgi:hypothetical protein